MRHWDDFRATFSAVPQSSPRRPGALVVHGDNHLDTYLDNSASPFPVLLPSSLLVLPGIPSQTKDLHYNIGLRVCSQENPN